MKDPHLLHVFSPTKYVSPFDINMAYEAHYDAVVPYCNITLDEVYGLTQDTIFSRRPEGVRRTGIFIGGRDFHLALEMLKAARDAMVPPFEVSVLVDPSGAITTAASMVALVERWLQKTHETDLLGKDVYIFGGTGPVGTCVALLAARCGANVSLVSHTGVTHAQQIAQACQDRYDVSFRGVDGSTPAAVREILARAHVVFNTAKAGVRVIDGEALAGAHELLAAADANAVPPSGIDGIGSRDAGVVLATPTGKAIGLGALAVGDIKYRVHTGLLQQMYYSTEALYLAYAEAFELAQEIVRRRC
ncbi:MAG: methylenetetrahydromethanopterin dehydrogenase [Gammaproteobacteria bacterium]|nr:methylenetetrahydromethanopterin dehydrogenase [Gammaproteobacteria bacterium]MBI5618871.1 methylenetetrahydromethanopterin dehydrogenase [Gammaproteobacteria bacterium]